MPGAGKKRGKIDKKNGSGPAATDQPPAGEPSSDGPPPAGRGRPAENPGPSGSRDISVAGSAAGPPRDPARDAAIFLNRNVDFAGNAYNLIHKVSLLNLNAMLQKLFVIRLERTGSVDTRSECKLDLPYTVFRLLYIDISSAFAASLLSHSVFQ